MSSFAPWGGIGGSSSKTVIEVSLSARVRITGMISAIRQRQAAMSASLAVVKKRFGGTVTGSEIGLRATENGLVLPCGASAIWSK